MTPLDDPVVEKPKKVTSRLFIDASMLLLAIASLGLVLYEISYEADLTAETRRIIDFVDLAIVLVFVAEFTWSARRSGNPWQYIRRNWFDLPSMIWLPGDLVNGLVSLRLLRLVRLVRVLRTVARLRRISGHFRSSVLQERVVYIAAVAVATILFGAMSAYVVEHDTNPEFGSLWDGVWWALVTTATVGYGDVVPITVEGRLVAAVLMIVGVGIIGTLAGTMAQFLLARSGSRARKRIYSQWHKTEDG